MPTYEYECDQCGHRFERFEKMSAQPLAECPECGSSVRRLFGSGGGVLFRGRGGANRKGASTCGREQPCCGRDVPCERRPCE
jgi:putative FmdB family regulatory protein